MKLTIFTDELKLDLADGIKTLKDWGFRWLDLRGRIFGSISRSSTTPSAPAFAACSTTTA